MLLQHLEQISVDWLTDCYSIFKEITGHCPPQVGSWYHHSVRPIACTSASVGQTSDLFNPDERMQQRLLFTNRCQQESCSSSGWIFLLLALPRRFKSHTRIRELKLKGNKDLAETLVRALDFSILLRVGNINMADRQGEQGKCYWRLFVRRRNEFFCLFLSHVILANFSKKPFSSICFVKPNTVSRNKKRQTHSLILEVHPPSHWASKFLLHIILGFQGSQSKKN